MVTGFPEVRLTPYMGAVVLNVDLQSRAGVDGDSQVVLSSEASFFKPSLPLPSTIVELPTVELVDEVSKKDKKSNDTPWLLITLGNVD